MGICVVGVGSPASTYSSRSHVSLGDAAPRSTSGSAIFNDFRPRAPRYRLARSSTSSAEISRDRDNESSFATASSRGRYRPRSNAVRSRVVTGSLPTYVISSSASASFRTIRPGCRRARLEMSSISMSSSTHCAPCNADAATPAITPRRSVASHAASARSRNDNVDCFGE